MRLEYDVIRHIRKLDEENPGSFSIVLTYASGEEKKCYAGRYPEATALAETALREGVSFRRPDNTTDFIPAAQIAHVKIVPYEPPEKKEYDHSAGSPPRVDHA